MIRNTLHTLRIPASALVLLFLAGCFGAPSSHLPVPWTAPEEFDATRRESFQIFHRGSDDDAPRTLVGFVYRQSRSDEEISWVKDALHRRQGFQLRSGHAFRLVSRPGKGGTPTVGHEHLGELSREAAIAALLGLEAGEIDLELFLSDEGSR